MLELLPALMIVCLLIVMVASALLASVFLVSLSCEAVLGKSLADIIAEWRGNK